MLLLFLATALKKSIEGEVTPPTKNQLEETQINTSVVWRVMQHFPNQQGIEAGPKGPLHIQLTLCPLKPSVTSPWVNDGRTGGAYEREAWVLQRRWRQKRGGQERHHVRASPLVPALSYPRGRSGGRLREERAKRRGQFSRLFSSASQSFLGSNFGKSFPKRK